MEYCCHVWTGAPSCYLELFDKLKQRICGTIDPSLANSLETLAHCRNVASLSLFYSYYFRGCSSELAQLVPLPFGSFQPISPGVRPKSPQKLFIFSPFLGIIERRSLPLALALTVHFSEASKVFQILQNFLILRFLLIIEA